MANDVDITPLIDTGYVQKVVQEGQNAVFKNGRLVYIILDVDKPGKYFYDLRQVFNASTGEGGKDIKIMFMNNVEPWQLNGKHVGVVGKYPSGESFNVTGSTNQANSSLVDFVFPQGFFQEAGIYRFQFVISDDSQNIATSHYCFFQVTQSAMSMALDWNNGVNPFDNDYMEWKQKVEQQVSGLSTSVKKLQELVDTYTDSVNTAIDNAWSSKLNSENTWTAAQHFRSITADTVGANNLNGTNLNIDTSASLPANTTVNAGALKNVGNKLSRGLFVLEAEYNASTVSSENQNGASFLNGVTTGTANNHYMGFRVFRCEISDGSTRTLIEIHSNCSFPSDINGKPVVQFPSSSTMWDGIDQTPFVLGKWIMMFEKSTHTLKVLSKVNPSDNDQLCLDARMI